ncbi:MAG: porphobilinogen synthase [Gammaproteobacteria bacterium]
MKTVLSLSTAAFPTSRLRRLRQHPTLRTMVEETRLSAQQFVQPLFVCEGKGVERPIPSMPGCVQQSVDTLPTTLEILQRVGINSVMIFGIPSQKDAIGTAAWEEQGIVQQAISTIHQCAPHCVIISDVCFCEYTNHGHCGVLQDTSHGKDVNNDATLVNLAAQAVSHAKAGAHVVAPSGMMDGMVSAIRQGLDDAGFTHIPILSYAVKYASALYGPFRDAGDVTVAFGDRRTYQMNPANSAEALREAALDVQEGADLLMVKPAGWYLDVVQQIKQAHPGIPLVAYQVSGEYAMIKAAAAQGWLDEKALIRESLLSIARAGADVIITYYAKEIAALINSNSSSPPSKKPSSLDDLER